MLDARTITPRINLRAAPPTEVADLKLLNIALIEMEQYAKQFSQAVALFDYCLMQFSKTRLDVFSEWMFIAARDAVMSVWHFRKQMETSNQIANKSAYLAKSLEKSLFKDAYKKFRLGFPDFEAIRHAVAHAGELSKNADSHEKHSFSGTYEGTGIKINNSKNVMLKNALQDRTYTSTFEGRIVHCEISAQSIQKLMDVQEVFFDAFREKENKMYEASVGRKA